MEYCARKALCWVRSLGLLELDIQGPIKRMQHEPGSGQSLLKPQPYMLRFQKTVNRQAKLLPRVVQNLAVSNNLSNPEHRSFWARSDPSAPMMRCSISMWGEEQRGKGRGR